MTPTEAITTLEELIDGHQAVLNHLRTESVSIAAEWRGLGAAGGQREDHAAQLLKRLLPDLRKLGHASQVAHNAIQAMVDDPFKE